jgi:hypothetical protein
MKKLIIILFFFPVLMFGQITGFFNQSNAAPTGGGGHDVDVQAWVDEIVSLGGTAPDEANLLQIDTLVTSLKTAGVWQKFDCFYLHAQNGSVEASRVNMANPGVHTAIIYNGTLTRSTKNGVLLANSSSAPIIYIDNISISSLNYWQNDNFCFGFTLNQSGPGNAYAMGNLGASLSIHQTNTLVYYKALSSGNFSLSNNPAISDYTTSFINRTSSSSFTAYRDLVSSVNTSSQYLSIDGLQLCLNSVFQNNTNLLIYGSNHNYHYVCLNFFGASLTTQEINDMDAAYYYYLDNL